jgi:protein-tyrosine-phosphatase
VTFDVLFVCSANICRSPLAEAVARQRVGAGTSVRFASAGVRAKAGSERCPASVRWLNSKRRKIPVHYSQPVTVDGARDADLIVALDRAVMGQLLTRLPELRPRLFTLREAVALAAAVRQPVGNAQHVGSLHGGSDEDTLDFMVGEMDASRGLVPVLGRPGRRLSWRADPPPFDIPDVHRASSSWSHGQVLPMVATETRTLVDSLFGML